MTPARQTRPWPRHAVRLLVAVGGVVASLSGWAADIPFKREDAGPGLLDIGGALVIVVAVLIGGLALLKRLKGPWRSSLRVQGPALRVTDRVALTRSTTLVVVECEGAPLLIACGDGFATQLQLPLRSVPPDLTETI